MKKIILASNNAHKIKEIKKILADLNIEVRSLKDEEINLEIIEDGSTFEENSKKKASEIAKFLKQRGDENFIVLADDSGLEVDYLKGAPGIYSARYAGEHGNDKKNNKKLLNELLGVPLEKRNAKFVCHLSIVDSNYNYFGIRGEVEGKILSEVSGCQGFGYDPIFYYEPLKKTFGEISDEEKNKISHRAVALQKLKDRILEII